MTTHKTCIDIIECRRTLVVLARALGGRLLVGYALFLRAGMGLAALFGSNSYLPRLIDRAEKLFRVTPDQDVAENPGLRYGPAFSPPVLRL